jgi:methylmalonyl-CoA mutase N-terminal domain/subunit
VETGNRVVVGLNRYRQEDEVLPELWRIDEAEVEAQKERVRDLRRRRDPKRVEETLDAVRASAGGTDNLLPPMKEALRSEATLGEVSDALREAFGEYRPGH